MKKALTTIALGVLVILLSLAFCIATMAILPFYVVWAVFSPAHINEFIGILCKKLVGE